MLPALNNPRANGVARSFSIECQDQRHDDAWDEFVESLPVGHHEQTSLWGQIRNQNGWEVRRIIIRENEKIVTGTQMQIRSLGRFGKLAYVTYGPCLKSRRRLPGHQTDIHREL
jgi:lipid II:glycine glycyltransferase (peptidoglycan interpeptide bridge formation enzyme)